MTTTDELLDLTATKEAMEAVIEALEKARQELYVQLGCYGAEDQHWKAFRQIDAARYDVTELLLHL